MSIIRAARPQSNFYILDKHISEDVCLSWAARGLLIFLLGKPDHWRISVEHLRKASPDKRGNGREAIYGYINELIDTGYISRKKLTTGEMDYYVSEVPSKPHSAYPDQAYPDQAQTTLVSNDVKQTMKVVKTQQGDLPEWLPEESWKAFLEMRKSLRKPMTEKAKGLMLKKLIGFQQRGLDIASLLDNSTMNSWLDVYEPKSGRQQQIDRHGNFGKQDYRAGVGADGSF